MKREKVIEFRFFVVFFGIVFFYSIFIIYYNILITVNFNILKFIKKNLKCQCKYLAEDITENQ